MSTFESQLRESAADVAALGTCAADVAALDSASLLAAQHRVAILRRQTDTVAAWIAAEIAHRSRYELGHEGMAQQNGFLSPEALIQSVTHISRAEAAKLVSVGTMMAETEAAAAMGDVGWGVAGSASDASASASADADADAATDPSRGAQPDDGAQGDGVAECAADLVSWHAPIGVAVSTGDISLEAADIIRKVLGSIESTVAADSLRHGAERLISEARSVNTDQLYRRARQLRDQLDADGIAERETARHEARYLRVWQQADGMYRGSWQLDPENGRLVAAAFDTILSPRRGGPRFVELPGTVNPEKARAEALVKDERTNEQIAADALVDLVQLAVDADPGTMFGSRRPAVRIIVNQTTLTQRDGSGAIEGHTDPVSLATIERHLCNAGGIPIGFDDDGQCINVGREQRLFTAKQRIGLAVRDGGCRFAGCDRAPSMCEAHHIDQWHRDHGSTDLADGILLCRRHHMLLHNNLWDVIRDRADYWLRPPKSLDSTQGLIAMPSKNPLLEVGFARRA